MGFVEPANRGRRDRAGVDLTLGERVHDLVLEREWRGFDAALAERHRRDRADLHADALPLCQFGERRRTGFGPNRQCDPAAVIRLRHAQAHFRQHRAVGDRIEDDIAVGAAVLKGVDHPVLFQRDVELFRQRSRDFNLKAGNVTVPAGKRQRVGVCAQRERATLADRFQRTRGGVDDTEQDQQAC